MKKQDRFLQGYACCLAAIINMNGCGNTHEREAYYAGFGKRTIEDLQNIGIEQDDIDLFIKEGYIK